MSTLKAISLVNEVKSSNQEASIINEEIKVTPVLIIANAHIRIGLVHNISGNFQEAQKSFEKTYNLIPSPEIRFQLALSILRQGNLKRALNIFKSIVSENPESDEAIKAKKMLMESEQFKTISWLFALILSIFLGLLGIDRFYLGYYKLGFIKLITFGGFYLWWIIDIIRIATNSLRDVYGIQLEK